MGSNIRRNERWAARFARGGLGAPRGRATSLALGVTSPAGLRARRCSRSSRPRRLRQVSGVRVILGAAWGGGAAVFPAWVFPPAPPFRRRPLSECGSSAGGQTHPRKFRDGSRGAW